MPSYLWSVTNAEGRVGGQRVEAPSPEAARAILEAQGFTNLKLQQDDFGNALDAGLAVENPIEDKQFTPDEELEDEPLINRSLPQHHPFARASPVPGDRT